MTETPSSTWVGAWQQTESLLALREFSDVSRRVMPAHPSTVLVRDTRALLHPEAPLRFMSASVAARLMR